MSYLTQHGIYELEYDGTEKRWTLGYLFTTTHEYDAVPSCVLSFPGDIHVIKLLALDAISAFVRGANEILNKVEELNDRK